MLAYDYPLLGIFWSLMLLFMFVVVGFVVVYTFVDNFRRSDHSGLAKAGWALVIIVATGNEPGDTPGSVLVLWVFAVPGLIMMVPTIQLLFQSLTMRLSPVAVEGEEPATAPRVWGSTSRASSSMLLRARSCGSVPDWQPVSTTPQPSSFW